MKSVSHEDLRRQIARCIEEEEKDQNKYEDLMSKVYEDNKLDAETQNLIAGMLTKIASDEESHIMLLTTIADVMESIEWH